MANWTWFHKWGSPPTFYRFSGLCLPWLGGLAAALLLVGGVWALAFVPPDFKQGNSFRVMYIHVPAAAVAMAGYMLMATAGAINLIWRMKLADMVVQCAAPIGAALTFLALVTGSIWGKPTWGAWWVWDARVVSVLVMFFLYIGVIALYNAFDNKDAAGRACSVLALVGAVNVPIIYYSVEWWYSLHQPASISFTKESSIHPTMLRPLLVMILGYYLFYATVLFLNLRAEIIARESGTRWVRELVGAR